MRGYLVKKNKRYYAVVYEGTDRPSAERGAQPERAGVRQSVSGGARAGSHWPRRHVPGTAVARVVPRRPLVADAAIEPSAEHTRSIRARNVAPHQSVHWPRPTSSRDRCRPRRALRGLARSRAPGRQRTRTEDGAEHPPDTSRRAPRRLQPGARHAQRGTARTSSEVAASLQQQTERMDSAAARLVSRIV